MAAFCLVVERDGNVCLSKSHSYFYQIQTQMHVTCLQWCDFVVWSPLHEPFVQRIKYDADFMKSTISTAGKFYFEQFLPAVVPYMIMSPTSRPSASSSVPPVKVSELISSHTQISSTLPPKKPSSSTLPLHSDKETGTLTASDDVQIVATNKVNLLSLDYVLQQLHVVRHVVKEMVTVYTMLFPTKLDLFPVLLKVMRKSVFT